MNSNVFFIFQLFCYVIQYCLFRRFHDHDFVEDEAAARDDETLGLDLVEGLLVEGQRDGATIEGTPLGLLGAADVGP